MTLLECALGLQVEWVQASDPSKGFKYLYLSDADYRALTQGAGSATLRAQPLQAEGRQRWRLTDVVGAEDGLGVECLSGSGAIARWASRIIMAQRMGCQQHDGLVCWCWCYDSGGCTGREA